MRFNHIDAFRAVMLSGSMTAAARELHTSQPNISRLIGQLEKETGLTLFQRMSGRLQATPEAHAFYRDVQRAYVGLNDLRKSAQSIRKLGTGHLRIGAVPSMALTVVPIVMRAFSTHYPDVRVSMHTSDSITVAQWTASRYCDIGIASYISDSPGVDAQRVRELDGVCVVPEAHRLARGTRALGPRDLHGEPFISLSYGDRRQTDRVFAQNGEDQRLLAYETQYAAAACKLVGLGMGVSIVNPVVARHYEQAGIAIRRFRPRIPFTTYLLYPLQSPSSELTRDFARRFVQHMHEAV
ncbi:LysR substrate-binding domain-containing protein [Orrella sp. JC864]|uniref:LysR substrate-binding domain-containing protein n=1 Tax=Orrella sp. JC864 TaxID=3120298 RepID=UPI0012BCCB15